MTRNGYWLSVALGGVAVILAITNAALFSNNRLQQAEINGRAQFIQQSVQLEGLYNEMVRALAELSARSNDEQLKSLLQGVGITFSVNGQGGGATGQSQPPRK
ncbi:MAG: hypothetical protein U1E86_13685 [Burkholderiaceae bacterium]